MLSNASLNTYIQSWSRCLVCIFCAGLFALHLLGFILVVVQSPDLFMKSNVLGEMCRKQEPSGLLESNMTSMENCDSVKLFEKVDRLDELTFSFRFPSDETKPSSFSSWNWRIWGGLILELSFKEKDYGRLNDSGSTSKEELIPIILSATLDINPEQDEMSFDIDENSNNPNFTVLSDNYERIAVFKGERTLFCSPNSIEGLNTEISESNELIYICTVTPLFDLHLVSNKTYFLSIGIQNTDNSTFALNQGQNNDFLSKSVIISGLSLNLITDNAKFHQGVMFLKSASTPFILMALLLFCARMYLNDLYISIPDRLLITVGMAQLIQNFPIEIILLAFPGSKNVIFLKHFEDFGQIFLMTSMFLFWIIYTKDKLARNEPWERNTRYYWRQIVCVCSISLLAALYITYTKNPILENPFNNLWQPHTLEGKASITFLIILGATAMLIQAYLSIIIFRVLCDVSIIVVYQKSSLKGGIWRLKMVLSYCSAVSFVTICHLLLKLALDVSFHWNPLIFDDPLPFHFSFASAFFLGVQGVWNLHTFSLLIMLSRGPRDFQDYVKTVSKFIENSAGSIDQYDDLHPDPIPLSIRRRNTSLQSDRRPSSEDFLEAMESNSKSSFNYDNQNEYYDSHHQSYIYESDEPDPGRSESSLESETPEIPDSPDILESLRRETVHLWETDNRSEPLLDRVYEDEEAEELQSLADQACYAHQRSKIIPASSRGYER